MAQYRWDDVFILNKFLAINVYKHVFETNGSDLDFRRWKHRF